MDPGICCRACLRPVRVISSGATSDSRCPVSLRPSALAASLLPRKTALSTRVSEFLSLLLFHQDNAVLSHVSHGHPFGQVDVFMPPSEARNTESSAALATSVFLLATWGGWKEFLLDSFLSASSLLNRRERPTGWFSVCSARGVRCQTPRRG